jgi:Bacterial PH domain
MTFSVSYDSTTKVISASICALMVVLFAVTGQWLVGAIGLVILLGGYAWSPRGYTVQGATILVHRLVGDAAFSLTGVREVRTAAADDFSGAIRLFGSGGMFGYYGVFRTSKLGKSTWYLTRRDPAVVIVTEQKTALFSPDDRDGFLGMLRAVVPPEGMRPAVVPYRASRVPLIAGIAVGVTVLGLITAALMYAPGPPATTLTRDSLAIHDRFYPVTVQASAVDIDGIRMVDFAVDREWRATLRTNGFANSHYRSGWFRTANGKRVRLYRASATRAVLLPPKGDGTPVLLEAKDPAGFVRELREEWR